MRNKAESSNVKSKASQEVEKWEAKCLKQTKAMKVYEGPGWTDIRQRPFPIATRSKPRGATDNRRGATARLVLLVSADAIRRRWGGRKEKHVQAEQGKGA